MVEMKVLVVDENENDVKTIVEYLKFFTNIEITVICKKNIEDLVGQIILKKPDLIISETLLSNKDGMDVIKECLLFYPKLKCIFITKYNEFALRAFQLQAIDYIIKPLERNRFYQAMEKARKRIMYDNKEIKIEIEEKDKSLQLKYQNIIFYIPYSDILFIEKKGKKCYVHTTNKIYETNENISDIVKKLENNVFIQGHRSYVINTKKITHIKPHGETFIVQFQDYEFKANISKLKINEVKAKISSYLFYS
ncbi:LytR/AlgR family response regulator transcription factor [Sutcliffiella halmapala]|uniref:LytR/AlgR family response regulator transcription factor n=1 Tax=Sutcliffiella halmapala TaxID=79882 RepID=UPI000995BA6D|nr:LytTR family DNA-binding domain-containing protein [Sutcliffiella halmapala]